MIEEATELEFLEYFYNTADFGHDHWDIIVLLQKRFEEVTGRLVPEDYRIIQ